VYIDSSGDELDEYGRGRGTAFYHEMGHMIDHASNQFQSFSSEKNVDFYLALRADGAEITAKYEQMNDEEQIKFLMKLYNGSYNSFSDLIHPLSGNKITGRFNHEDTYWMQPGSVEKEAFAHFFEASMGNDPFVSENKKSILQENFPRAWNEFEKMLEQIANQ
jgi:hypothetical protein